MRVMITRKQLDAVGAVVFELADPAGGPLPPFEAGAHIDVTVPPGLVRQYSLFNSPTERHRYVIGVQVQPEGRGGSVAMHALAEGDQIRISEPRNNFALDLTAKRSLLFAGGIGVTPILCMAEQLAANNADFAMHYSARSVESMVLRERILVSSFAEKVSFHFDDGNPAQRLNVDEALGAGRPGTHVYVCGPAGYIDFVLNAARANGHQEANLHREYFAKGAAVPMLAVDASFRVKLASTGQVFEVPSDRSIVDVLREQGLQIETSCEQGVCGICLTRVLEGVPDHRDYYFTMDERSTTDQFTPCCSRSKTPLLVIDR